ncbi:MAG: hypothetical protein AAGF84_00225 [Planctomycetota bacterium]
MTAVFPPPARFDWCRVAARVVPLLVLVLICSGSIGCAANQDNVNWSSQRAWKSVNAGGTFSGITNVGINVLTGGDANSNMDFAANYNRQADAAMKSAAPADAVDEMIDELSQKLAVDLPNIPEIRDSPYQVVLAVGGVDKVSVGGQALDRVLAGIETQLRGNTAITNSFLVTANDRGNAQAILEQISGDTSDFGAADGRGPSGEVVRYDPSTIYRLNGTLSRLDDGANHAVQLVLTMRFNHVQSNRVIKSYEFDRTYYWQPYAQQWISADEEFARRAAEAAAGKS